MKAQQRKYSQESEEKQKVSVTVSSCGTIFVIRKCSYKIKTAIPLQAWTGPVGSRLLRLPDFKTIGA
jgi:hypothetical protein